MIKLATLASVTSLFASSVSAATVYSQSGALACAPECSTSHVANGLGLRTYDNFRLTAAANVTTVTWQGIYFGLLQGLEDPAPPPATTDWRIDFFGDASGALGPSLFSANLPFASVTTTFLGAGRGPNVVGAYDVNFYRFTATLPTGFEAAADTDYWFSPWSVSQDFLTFFLWSPASQRYDGVSLRTGAGGVSSLNFDHNFSLGASAAVPEPANWLMLTIGLGAVGVAIRRQKAAVVA